jgi:signal peptidase II
LPILALFLAATIVLADQLIKLLIVHSMDLGQTITAIPGLLDIVYVRNPGAALGLFANARWFFIVVTSILIVVFIVLVLRNRCTHKLFVASAILIIGGGVGNLIDRIIYGYVIDYLQLSFFPPVCNFADYCITIGTVLLLIYLLFVSDFVEKKQSSKGSGGGERNG